MALEEKLLVIILGVVIGLYIPILLYIGCDKTAFAIVDLLLNRSYSVTRVYFDEYEEEQFD
jgi:hypothetical protein